jgi:hypothetical protein
VTRLLAGLLPLLALHACDPAAPPSFDACDSPACRLERVEVAFAEDPQATLQALASLDPIEQEALVMTLVRAHPDRLELICDGAQEGGVGVTCSKIRERPHLSQAAPSATPPPRAPSRQAPGPSQRHPPVPTPATPAAASCDALPACACEGDALPGAGCEALATEVQRNECAFREAEALAQRCRWRQADRVLWLCSRSQGFANGCLHHSVSLMLPDLPPAEGADTVDVERALQAVAALEAAAGPELAPLYRDFFWALWVGRSTHHARQVDGRLLQVLPAEALPHARASLAYEWLRRSPGDLAGGLDAAVAAVAARLAEPGEPAPGPRHEPTIWKARDFWPSDLFTARESQIPAGFCMGPGRRAVMADPGLDLEIAVLEAAARLPSPPPAGFFTAVVMDDQRPLVLRWTALRLTMGLFPGEARALDLSGAPGALQARATAPPPEP